MQTTTIYKQITQRRCLGPTSQISIYKNKRKTQEETIHETKMAIRPMAQTSRVIIKSKCKIFWSS